MQPARKRTVLATSPPRRVLLVEASTGGVVDGSLTGILELLPELDPQRYVPALVLAEDRAGLDPHGVATHVLAPRPDAGPVIADSAATRAFGRRADLLRRAPACG